MLYYAGCQTVTHLLPYLYLGNVLPRGINSLLSRTTLLLSVCFAGIHTVLYDFQALISILQVHLSKTIKLYDRCNSDWTNPGKSFIVAGMNILYYTTSNSIWFSYGFARQGCVVHTPAFYTDLGQIFWSTYKKKKCIACGIQRKLNWHSQNLCYTELLSVNRTSF